MKYVAHTHTHTCLKIYKQIWQKSCKQVCHHFDSLLRETATATIRTKRKKCRKKVSFLMHMQRAGSAERGACGRGMAMMMWQPSREVCRIEASVMFYLLLLHSCVVCLLLLLRLLLPPLYFSLMLSSSFIGFL